MSYIYLALLTMILHIDKETQQYELCHYLNTYCECRRWKDNFELSTHH